MEHCVAPHVLTCLDCRLSVDQVTTWFGTFSEEFSTMFLTLCYTGVSSLLVHTFAFDRQSELRGEVRNIQWTWMQLWGSESMCPGVLNMLRYDFRLQ